MISRRMDCFLIVFVVFLKIKFLIGQEVNNTSGNQDGGLSSVDSRFFDPGRRGMGNPNLREPGRFGNSPSNYPGNSFLPYGNQNDDMRRPRQGFGWRPDGRNPNQEYQPPIQGRPYRTTGNYPGTQGAPNDFPYQSDPNSFRPRPNDFDGGFNRGSNNMNQYPNYQRPSYPNRPSEGMPYPSNVNRPYEYEGMPQGQYPNRPIGVPGGSRRQMGYPPQNGQYPPQGNFQGNSDFRPGNTNTNFQPGYPDDVTNFPSSNIKYPKNEMPHQNQPNQYPLQNGFGNPGTSNIRPNQNGGYPSNPSNYPGNMEYPINNPSYNNNDGIQFPNEGSINQGQGNNQQGANKVFQRNFNGVPQTAPQLTNNQPVDSINGQTTNGTVAILGKPVFVPSATASPGQVFDGSANNDSQKQCIRNCPVTSEYNPICGTNNVTYVNQGSFNCALNCGVSVNVSEKGRCLADTILN